MLLGIDPAERLDPESLPEALDTREIRGAVEELMLLTKVDIQKEIYEGRLKAQRDALTAANAMARVEARLAEAEAEASRATAEAARAAAEGAEAMGKGILVGRIGLLQKLLRQAETPLAELEAMSLESLAALAQRLERELSL